MGRAPGENNYGKLFAQTDAASAGRLVDLILLVVHTVKTKLSEMTEQRDGRAESIADYFRQRQIRLVLKGGNSVFLIVHQALQVIRFGNACRHTCRFTCGSHLGDATETVASDSGGLNTGAELR